MNPFPYGTHVWNRHTDIVNELLGYSFFCFLKCSDNYTRNFSSPARGGTRACEHLSTKAARSQTKSAYRLRTDVSFLARWGPEERVRTCSVVSEISASILAYWKTKLYHMRVSWCLWRNAPHMSGKQSGPVRAFPDWQRGHAGNPPEQTSFVLVTYLGFTRYQRFTRGKFQSQWFPVRGKRSTPRRVQPLRLFAVRNFYTFLAAKIESCFNLVKNISENGSLSCRTPQAWIKAVRQTPQNRSTQTQTPTNLCQIMPGNKS